MYTIIHFRETNASDPNEAADVLVQVQTSAVNQTALNRLNEAVAEKKLDDAADPDEIVAYAMDKAFGEGNWWYPKTREVEF